MKLLLKLILLVILTSISYSQGKIVSIETITRDFGEVTEEIEMSVSEFMQLISKSKLQPETMGFMSRSIERPAVKQKNTVGLKFNNGKLVIEESNPFSRRNSFMMSAGSAEVGFKEFNVDMINSLNSMGGEAVIKIQSRSGELVLTNGDVSYNYIGFP